jgi:hypothetical protein
MSSYYSSDPAAIRRRTFDAALEELKRLYNFVDDRSLEVLVAECKAAEAGKTVIDLAERATHLAPFADALSVEGKTVVLMQSYTYSQVAGMSSGVVRCIDSESGNVVIVPFSESKFCKNIDKLKWVSGCLYTDAKMSLCVVEHSRDGKKYNVMRLGTAEKTISLAPSVHEMSRCNQGLLIIDLPKKEENAEPPKKKRKTKDVSDCFHDYVCGTSITKS